MKTYSKNEIETFLKAVDSNLNQPFTLVIIGGAAASLAYKATRHTKDIDTVNQVTSIAEACEKAKQATGLHIPLGPTGVEDGPYNYEDRLINLAFGLKHLTIQVPEKHDLILMKMLRGYQHDLDVAVEIHGHAPLSLVTLIHRMKTEMTHVMGNRLKILWNFYALIEAVFGTEHVQQAQAELKGWEKE